MRNTTKAMLCTAFAAAIGFSGCDESNINPVYTLNYLAENLERSQSISYDAMAYQKYFDKSDTLNFSGSARLVRDQSDTVFGGYIHFTTDKGMERLYDLDNIYSLNPGYDTTVYDASKGQSFGITGNVTKDLVNWFFLDPSGLRGLAADSTVSLSVSPDTLMDGRACFTVTARYPNEEGFSDQERRIFVSHDVDEVLGYSYRSTFQGNTQFDSVIFRNMVSDKLDAKMIMKTRDSLLQSYKWTAYEEPNESFYKLLADGTVAPEFSGTDPLTGDMFSLADFEGKVVILDFFYMSCMPCIKSIPKFSALQKKFGDRGLVVVGVNSKDNHPEGKKKLPGFIEKQSMDYLVVLVDESVDQAYNVNVYPSMYIIGKDGKVLTSLLGFADKMEEYLTRYLENILK